MPDEGAGGSPIDLEAPDFPELREFPQSMDGEVAIVVAFEAKLGHLWRWIRQRRDCRSGEVLEADQITLSDALGLLDREQRGDALSTHMRALEISRAEWEALDLDRNPLTEKPSVELIAGVLTIEANVEELAAELGAAVRKTGLVRNDVPSPTQD